MFRDLLVLNEPGGYGTKLVGVLNELGLRRDILINVAKYDVF